MRRQVSTYLDPDANPADRKLLSALRREARGKRSMSRAVYDALLEYYGLAFEPGTVAVLPGMENVYVDCLAGRFPMRAAVTPRSVKELDLAAGRKVVLAFKALSVKLTPR